MGKKPNNFIRLPVHLAYKTCPRASVDCYLELTPEHPGGDLHQRCATCLSAQCGFRKMDKDAREELRAWLDKELGRRSALAKANPTFGRAMIDNIIELDVNLPIAVGRGVRTKRNRTMYVDSDSVDDGGKVARPNTRARLATTIDIVPVTKGPAFESDFVQQAIKLVTSSRTVDRQLADLQMNNDAAVKARANAEQTTIDMDEKKTTAEKARDKALEKAKDLQGKLDNVRQNTEADDLAWAKAERRQTLFEDTTKRLRRERDAVKEQLETANKAISLAEGKVQIADEARNVLQGELEKERAVHDETTKEMVKWKNAVANLL